MVFDATPKTIGSQSEKNVRDNPYWASEEEAKEREKKPDEPWYNDKDTRKKLTKATSEQRQRYIRTGKI